MRNQRLAALALVALAAACSGSTTGPGGTSATSLHFLRAAVDAPPLADTSVTFWAYRSKETEATIWYRPRSGETDSTEFVDFTVPNNSIKQDSVQITITVVDPANLIVQFEPAGLKFSATNPAQLSLNYTQADSDINDDGTVDSTDTALKGSLGVWRQETTGGLWFPVPSTSVEASDDVEAVIYGFTRYAIAY